MNEFKQIMNTKLLMMLSSILLGITGIGFSFLPQEIGGIIGINEPGIILLQVMGALYFGFAAMNWMAKANLIGGIYGKPVAIGNFSHFLIGALALSKIALKGNSPALLWLGAAFYLVFALLFGFVFFTTPKGVNKAASVHKG